MKYSELSKQLEDLKTNVVATIMAIMKIKQHVTAKGQDNTVTDHNNNSIDMKKIEYIEDGQGTDVWIDGYDIELYETSIRLSHIIDINDLFIVLESVSK